MIKYYRASGFNYQYGTIFVKIEEYYLLKEGWIECYNYREDFNDSYYILDSYGTPGTRKDYCEERNTFKDEEMFESLEEAKKYFKTLLYAFYQEEAGKLLLAYKKIENEVLNNKGEY